MAWNGPLNTCSNIFLDLRGFGKTCLVNSFIFLVQKGTRIVSSKFIAFEISIWLAITYKKFFTLSILCK